MTSGTLSLTSIITMTGSAGWNGGSKGGASFHWEWKPNAREQGCLLFRQIVLKWNVNIVFQICKLLCPKLKKIEENWKTKI